MKNKVLLRFLLAGLVLVVYIFFAAVPTGKQVFVKPLHISSIETPYPASSTIINPNNEELFPFVSGLAFGYYNKSGEIVFSQPQEQNFSISDNLWAKYSPLPIRSETAPQMVQCFSPDGSQLCSVPANGLLHFRKNRIFVFLQSANALAEYSLKGELLWTYAVSGVITAFDCNESLVVIGTSDGCITCLNLDGSEKFSFYPSGSEYQVIYGIALSTDGAYIGCLCGLNKQRLILIETTDYHKIVFHEYLKKSLLRQATLFFDETSRYLVMETGDGLSILNCTNFSLVSTNIQGRLVSTKMDSSIGVLGLLTQEEGFATISFFDLNSKKIGSEKFECTSSSLAQFGDFFYLGLDEKLLTFTMEKQ